MKTISMNNPVDWEELQKGKKPFRIRKSKDKTCRLCGINIPSQSLTRHHLIPQELGGKGNKVPLHKLCHAIIHIIFSNKELANSYNRMELIKADARIKRFIKFIHNRPSDFYIASPMAATAVKEIRERILLN